jgi:predicted Rossmann fold nucleotide-binding protein DprA/Smf involved in DNA uptake
MGIPTEQQRVLNCLNSKPTNVDDIVATTGWTAAQVIGILTLLEMRGLCRRVPGNNFVKVED